MPPYMIGTLVSIVHAFAVQHAQQGFPSLVDLRAAWSLELIKSFLGSLFINQARFNPATGQRVDLDLARSIKVVHQLKSLANRIAQRQQTVIAQDHGLGLGAEIGRQARSLVKLQRDALIVVI